MFRLVRYTDDYKTDWDEFISTSKNGSFLFYRDFIEYHSHKFSDLSFLFFYKKNVVAVIPGNVDDNTFYSHNGLTYGGMVLSAKLGIEDILEIFVLLNTELKSKGILEVIYKPLPYIYSLFPSQEDLYVLFQLKAERIACNISTTIYQNARFKYNKSRRNGVRKGTKNNVRIVESNDYASFWNILNNHLIEKYNVLALHSLEEILYLKSKFPKNIKLFQALYENNVVAGTVLFNNKNIVHVQYTSSSELGRSLGALDVLFDELLNSFFVEVPIFDFGTSTERMGEVLNENLIYQKEGFGGRGVVYETYRYNL